MLTILLPGALQLPQVVSTAQRMPAARSQVRLPVILTQDAGIGWQDAPRGYGLRAIADDGVGTRGPTLRAASDAGHRC